MNLERVFNENSFGAVFSITTIEFIEDYEAVVRGIYRVLRSGGKFIIMILNPESEYFKEHGKRRDSYFHRIKHRSPAIMRNYFLRLFELEKERYFLGIKGKKIINTDDRTLASLYIIIGRKK